MTEFRPLLIAALLVGLTLAVFSPLGNHDFVWDDEVNLTANPYLNPPIFSHLLSLWQKPYEGLYIPLTYTLWGTIARFASVDPGRAALQPFLFHAANLALHILSVLAVFAILRTLVKKDWAAGGGALLFAVHPLQVEPVAWITGMRDILSGLLSLLAVWFYLRYAGGAPISLDQGPNPSKGRKGDKAAAPDHRWLNFGVGTAAFLLALLAKPSAVVTPVIAGALGYWMLKRPFRQCARALALWLVLAVPFVLLTKLEQPNVAMAFVPPYWTRPLIAGDVVAFYLYKLFVPVWLGPDYGRTPGYVLQQGWIYVAWMVPLGLVTVAWWRRKESPWLMASLAVFIAGILPVLGLIPFAFQRFSTVADRYLYLSMLGPALALGCLLTRSSQSWLYGCTVLMLGSLTVGTVFQTRVWRDGVSLFAHALRINPDSPMAHNNLGSALALRGLPEEALMHYREALRLKPDYADPHNNWAVILFGRGQLEAVEHFREAVRLDPFYAEAHYNLGNALVKQGRLEESIVHFKEAVGLSSTHIRAHNNLANALARNGNPEEAVEHYRQALRMNPNWVEARYNLGSVLAKKGDLDGAVVHFREAIRLQPEFVVAHEALGRALTAQGRQEEAVEHFENALRILKSQAKGITSP